MLSEGAGALTENDELCRSVDLLKEAADRAVKARHDGLEDDGLGLDSTYTHALERYEHHKRAVNRQGAPSTYTRDTLR